MSLTVGALDLGSPFAVQQAVAEWARVAAPDEDWALLFGVALWDDFTPDAMVQAVRLPARVFLGRYGSALSELARGLLEDLAGPVAKHYGPGPHESGTPQTAHAGTGTARLESEWTLAPDEQATMNAWAGDSYQYQDALLNPNSDKHAAAKALVAAWERAPRVNGIVYRGVGGLSSWKDLKNLPFKPGAEFTLNVPISTSRDEGVADDFASGITAQGQMAVRMVLRIKSGVDVSKMVPEEWQFQEEVILLPGTRFRVNTASKVYRGESGELLMDLDVTEL